MCASFIFSTPIRYSCAKMLRFIQTQYNTTCIKLIIILKIKGRPDFVLLNWVTLDGYLIFFHFAKKLLSTLPKRLVFFSATLKSRDLMSQIYLLINKQVWLVKNMFVRWCDYAWKIAINMMKYTGKVWLKQKHQLHCKCNLNIILSE